ncbi:MAG: ABC transporter permease subunit [Nitrospiraceae bacterium]|nr:ABC transporter permease subunit [Nitrospiraceae bacterium]
MAIVTDVERRAMTTKVIIGLVYVLLTIGGLSMLYPFALMIASASTNKVDYYEYRLIPRYLYDDDLLFTKYWQMKHLGWWGGNRRPMLLAYQRSDDTYNQSQWTLRHFSHLHKGQPDYIDWQSEAVRQRVADYYEFKWSLPEKYTRIYFWSSASHFRNAERFQDWLKRKYGSIESLNEAYGTDYEVFKSLDSRDYKVGAPVFRWVMPYNYFRHVYVDYDGQHYRDWMEWRREALTPQDIGATTIDPWYQYYLLGKYKRADARQTVEALNQDWGTQYEAMHDIEMPEQAPKNPKERTFWEMIVRDKMARAYLRLVDCQEEFTEFLKGRYTTVEELNQALGADYGSFEDIVLPEDYPEGDAVLYDEWARFVEVAPLESIRVIRVERMYQDFLREKYGAVDALNGAYETSYASFSEIRPPYKAEDTVEVMSQETRWRLYFIFRNYWTALMYLFVQGNAFWNTSVLVGLHVLIQLIINPLAAYALSRYKLRYGNAILLFVVATMAFPPEVAMIPRFLMLRNFGLLNTYWAIVLPWMAQGYFIFLLKGFFDSLPPELFDQGKIDGASEMRMFFQVVIPICKPIFAVIALQAFRAMYSAFMFALLVCQEKSKWTLMVFIYQYQQTQGVTDSEVMAALVLSALPTLVVFLMVQKVILRGIVIPQMK